MVKKVTAAGSDASAPQQYYAPYLSGADLTEVCVCVCVRVACAAVLMQ